MWHINIIWLLELTRIHGDEDTTGPDQVDLPSLKDEPRRPGGESRQDGQNLLRHHRQHFNVDSVELIKAAPGTSLNMEERKSQMNALYVVFIHKPTYLHRCTGN